MTMPAPWWTGRWHCATCWKAVPAYRKPARRIVQHEDKADAIARDVLVGVRRSFITPFDRGDIKELINQLDDSIDQMQKTAKAITLFEVSSFELEMRQMADIILRCAELTVEAVGLLSAMRDNVSAHQRHRRGDHPAGRTGRRAQRSRHQGAVPASTQSGDAMAFIVGNEIYDHLEKVVDRFEDVANRISGIVIEQV